MALFYGSDTVRSILIVVVTAALMGCASLVVEDTLPGINEMDSEYGYLILNLDSSWRHPNENPFLGRAMDLSLSAKGQLLKNVLFTKPDTRKILRLKPADYTVTFSMVAVG